MSFFVKKEIDIVALGNSIVDILSYQNQEFLEIFGLKEGEMTLVDDKRIEEIYEKLGSSTECSGGSVANSAVGFASLGGKASFIGKVADDYFGKLFVKDLEKHNVHFQTSPVKSKKTTGRSVILVTSENEGGNKGFVERTMATSLGISAKIDENDIDENIIKSAKLLLVEGYLWDSATAKSAIEKATKIAKKYDTKIVFTLSDASCVQRHHAEFIDFIKNNVCILLGNKNEMAELIGADDEQEILRSAYGFSDICVMTMGEKGSYIVEKNEVYKIDAFATDVHDVTGAGDLYLSGFLYGYLQNFDMEKTGRLASRTASEAIKYIGARPMQSLSMFLDEI